MANPMGMHALFKVNVNGKPVLATAAALNSIPDLAMMAVLGSKPGRIDLTLAAPVSKGQTVTVAYVGRTLTSEDTGQLAPFAAQNVTNAVTLEPPAIVSAATNAAGTVVTVTFNKLIVDPTGMHGNF